MNNRDDTKAAPLSDRHRLSYAEYGSPSGSPIILLHGMPGSRLFGSIFDETARRRNLRIIAPDRPGYGLSSPHPHPQLTELPDDILQLADSLDLGKFLVVGVSGGGPGALACAAKIPDRLTAVGLISAIGPVWMPQGMRGMMSVNRFMFTLGGISPRLGSALLAFLIRSSIPSMNKHVQNGTSPTPDVKPEHFVIVAKDQMEAVRQGSAGLHYDLSTILKRWDFDLTQIAARLFLWHGDADTLAPAALAHLMAEKLPHCEAVFFPGEGHTDTFTKHSDVIVDTLAAALQ